MSLNKVRNQSAFTLVELSIVIVIIGLIVGGVLTGKDLIRAAELRAVISERDKFVTAINTFRLKYNALPGDMTNATQFWGTDASCPNTPVDTTPKDVTCNGDGNGRIGVHSNLGSNFKESFRFWQHLGSSGLLENKYTGTSGSAAGPVTLGTNTPPSKITNAGWTVISTSDSMANGALSWLYFSGTYSNTFYFGAPMTGDITINPALTTMDAFSADSKIDDGKPGTGSIVSSKGSNGYASQNCATTNSETTAAYDIARAGVQCYLIFRRAF